jgi:hypothetical protein
MVQVNIFSFENGCYGFYENNSKKEKTTKKALKTRTLLLRMKQGVGKMRCRQKCEL